MLSVCIDPWFFFSPTGLPSRESYTGGVLHSASSSVRHEGSGCKLLGFCFSWSFMGIWGHCTFGKTTAATRDSLPSATTLQVHAVFTCHEAVGNWFCQGRWEIFPMLVDIQLLLGSVPCMARSTRVGGGRVLTQGTQTLSLVSHAVF